MGEFKEYWSGGSQYKLYVPNGANKGETLPLVVMLHGCTQDPDQFAEDTKMNFLAERENYLLLYPTVERFYQLPFSPIGEINVNGCWNWYLESNQHRGEGHPETIVQMIKDAERNLIEEYKLRVNWNKVFAAGLSAGGAMANILGVTYPDIFSGIAVCGGLPYGAVKSNIWQVGAVFKNGVTDPYECGENAYQEMKKSVVKKIPVIVFHGLADPIVHPVNGEQVITQWAQTHYRIDGGEDQVDVVPLNVSEGIVKGGRAYIQQIYKGNLELWLVNGMHHAWSGGSEKGKYTDPLGPDATSIIWDFFKKIDSQEKT